jgi:hypothetical protein
MLLKLYCVVVRSHEELRKAMSAVLTSGDMVRAGTAAHRPKGRSPTHRPSPGYAARWVRVQR